MLDVAILSGFIIIVVAVNRWLKTEIAEHQKNVRDYREGNGPLMLIPLLLLMTVSCNNETNHASAQEAPEATPYITQTDIDELDNEISDSVGRCMSARAYDGMKLFMTNCNGCHPAGEKGKGPSLVESKLPDFLIHFQVRQGLGDMPSFTKEQLPKENVQKIVLFIHELRKDKEAEKTAEN